MAFAENNTSGSLWARSLLDIVYKAKAFEASVFLRKTETSQLRAGTLMYSNNYVLQQLLQS
jgi:hypothetical protein